MTAQRPHMLRILSLDGGGVRGLSSLIILREIILAIQQTRQSTSPLRPCDVFELIVGTGTGGLSAILLGRMRLTVDQVIHEYIRMADSVFRPPSLLPQLNPFRSTFDRNVMQRFLNDVMNHHLTDPDALFFDPDPSKRCHTAVLATTSANLDAPPYVFRTNSSNPQFKIKEVARAISATTGIFPPVSLMYPPMQFIDASTAGYANPTEIALEEAYRLWPTKNVDLVLSIGTGNQRIVDASQERLAELSLKLMSSCEAVHDRVSRLLSPQTYFRFSVPQGLEDTGGSAWDEQGLPGRVAEITGAYLRKAGPSRDLASCVHSIIGVKASYGIPGNPDRSLVPVTIGQSSQPESEFRTYAREDIYLLGPILCSILQRAQHGFDDYVTVTLCRGERQPDGQKVLVKQYKGSRRDITRSQFEKDLAIYENIWHPAVLQFIGGSKATASLPFLVYQSPLGEDAQDFLQWFQRTTMSNPVEAILGLYDMRTSLKELREFERRHFLSLSRPLRGSVVCIRHHGGRPRFSLVYVAEVEQFESGTILPSGDITSYDEAFAHEELNTWPFYPIGDPRKVDPCTQLIRAFCDGIRAWLLDNHVHDPLQGFLSRPFDAIDPHQLGAALFECGWLGKSGIDVQCGGRNVGLGDIGYVNQEGRFEVVMNLHGSLVSVKGSGDLRPIWYRWITPYNGFKNNHMLEYHGEVYRRSTCSDDMGLHFLYGDLEYGNLDERHAWRSLQREAVRIVETNGLSIEPYELKLVTSVQTRWNTMIEAVAASGSAMDMEAGQENGGGMAVSVPVVYRFEAGTGLRVRDSGEPEVDMKVYHSFNSTPDSLNVDWKDDDRCQYTETRGNYRFKANASYWIHHLQLPPGVAQTSYIEDV